MTVEEYMQQVKSLLEGEFAAHNVYVKLSTVSNNAQMCYGALGDVCWVNVIAGFYDNGDKFAKVVAESCGVYCNRECFDSWPTVEELNGIIYACADFVQTVSEY